MSKYLATKIQRMTRMTKKKYKPTSWLLCFRRFKKIWSKFFQCTGEGSAEDIINKAKEEARAEEDPVKVSQVSPINVSHFFTFFVFQEGEDYYTIAHTVAEQISEQPGMLVGGSLKEYQIKG